jgi:hypothetical protein
MATTPRPDRTCATRTLKLARHLQRNRPDIVPAIEPLEGFATVLEGTDPSMKFQLRDALAPGTLPAVGTKTVAPLFNGTLVFANLTIAAGTKQYSVASNDLTTATKYAGLAVGPISQYAGQYGPNALAIQPASPPLTVAVPKGVYNDTTVQSWVNQLVQANSLAVESTAIVVLNPVGPLNTDADASRGVLGYHGKASVPYAFVNLLGPGLAIPDPDDLFALALSHEIAEMTVDPSADLANPEVCDPCGPNCQSPIRAYFDATAAFLGGSSQFPPPFDYGFFLNAIVEPSSATQCPAPSSSCAYAPPRDAPAAASASTTTRPARRK